MPLTATAQQLPSASEEVVDKIVAQERAEVQSLRQYSPLVETYIQYLRSDEKAGTLPNGDKYFLGRADLAKGIEIEGLERTVGLKRKVSGGLKEFFSTQFVPRGFLQMVYLDTSGFDRQHYKIEYLGREFLGEVRCMVFDVDPLPNSGKGRFVGRIWVEDQDYHIVRFNGAYGGWSLVSGYFNFDSWRMNVGKNQWLPALIYCEEGNVKDPKTKMLAFKPFRSQTRLWGYDIVGHSHEEQELTKVLVEPSTGIADKTDTATDYSPLQSEREWNRQAEDNVVERLERQGLLAPRGEVDKVLDTVINNIELTNNLDLQPEVRCRIMMTTTLESFTLGRTIVLSRGLVDVLPDEISLAAILARELAHVVLGQGLDTQLGFYDTLRYDDKKIFRQLDLTPSRGEEQAADEKAIELLRNSPYKEHYRTAQFFLSALKDRSKGISNLITPNLGDRVPTNWTIAPEEYFAEVDEKPTANTVVALPIGARIAIDPLNDQLHMLKLKPAGMMAESEKKPFQITPLKLYLTRQEDKPSDPAGGAGRDATDLQR